MPSVSQGTLCTVYFVMLMDTLNFSIVFPLMPSIAKQFGAGASSVGMMATTYSLCQMCAMPILGRLSDRYGRRPVLLISLLGTTLSSFGVGLARDFPTLIVARCLNGLSGATMGVVVAYVADVTTNDEKPVYMSYTSAANSIGMICGPALGGLLSHYGFAVPCYVSGALSLLNLLFAIPFLKESRWVQAHDVGAALNDPAQQQGGGSSAGEESLQGTSARIPLAAGYLFASGFLLLFGFAALESIVGFYLMDTFFNGDAQASGQFYGICFTCNGIVAFVMSFFFYRRIRRCLGEVQLIICGTLIRTSGFLFQSFAPTPVLFSGAMMCVVCGNQLILPHTSSTLTTMCHRSIYGRALGYSQSVQALARTLAPSVFGAAYDNLTHEFSFYACAATTLVAGGLILLATRAANRMLQRQESPTPTEVMASMEELEKETAAEGSVDGAAMAANNMRLNAGTLAAEQGPAAEDNSSGGLPGLTCRRGTEDSGSVANKDGCATSLLHSALLTTFCTPRFLGQHAVPT
eukprot:CAMPEP_0204250610 /NCGR_PEP_ID=MMETSP0361-20130328/100252_1 /ASSEMBLY_ACC=CAM_ASM_000343 /TAXON_ID=268821 /ORGANISM="Scrippsiella Hangoei, Strain SHTV-5" /LENGTH=519 /DNA_ID=CAMNT_0051223879 /DNA_START=1 /DNA_END=1559 /DNA_ORIENTATION=+